MLTPDTLESRVRRIRSTHEPTNNVRLDDKYGSY